jgi:hypothetical protein
MTMNPANVAQPNSALELLFGTAGGVRGMMQLVSSNSAGDLARSLEALPGEIRETAAKEVSKAAAGLLDVDLVGLLVEGWREYADLTSAARRTLAAAGSSELVRLATHRVIAEQEPHVDLLVDRRLVATVRFGLSVEFAVSALVAGVRAGLLVAVHTGRCDMTATLAVNGVEVISRQARLELPGVITLTSSIRLLPDREYAVAAAAEGARQVPMQAATGVAAAADGGKAAGPSTNWWVAAAAPASLTVAAPAPVASAAPIPLSPASGNEEFNEAEQRRADLGRKWWQR